MRLADFIETNLEPILREWVTFAETSGAAGRLMDAAALRDHATEMLQSIVTDLRTAQTRAEQAEKSKGKEPSAQGSDTAAEVHGAGRAESGFTVAEMVSEYRALRASVIRLWTQAEGSLTAGDLEDLMRFNEAIDQALAESVTRFTEDLDHSKEMFVAILGHDLRSPLHGILMGTQFMLDRNALDATDKELATRAVRSAKRMNQMVADLLDFTRGRLGSGLPVTRAPVDLAREVSHAVDEIRTLYPSRELQLDVLGDLRGNWDSARINQLLANLLGNAIHHSAPSTPITLTAEGRAEEVVLRVHNSGPPIPVADLPGLFSPFKRLRAGAVQSQDSSHLGLGLYIAEQIVTAHGGAIHVTSSSDGGTTFTVRLPR